MLVGIIRPLLAGITHITGLPLPFTVTLLSVYPVRFPNSVYNAHSLPVDIPLYLGDELISFFLGAFPALLGDGHSETFHSTLSTPDPSEWWENLICHSPPSVPPGWTYFLRKLRNCPCNSMHHLDFSRRFLFSGMRGIMLHSLHMIKARWGGSLLIGLLKAKGGYDPSTVIRFFWS